MTVSNTNTMNLQLEAIKSSKITSGNGKVYKLELDPDGDNLDEAEIKEYTIDYSGVDTLAEILNKAAEKTQNATSLTLMRNNKIKGVETKDVTQYDKTTGRRLVTIKDGTQESYTFNKSEVYSTSAGTTTKVNVEKNTPMDDNNRPSLGDWKYNNTFSKIGYGVFEIELLKDSIFNKSIEAITKVEETDTDTYTVTINKEKLNEWLNTNYVDFDNIKTTGSENSSDTNTFELQVKLSKEGYITNIKTLSEFSIKGSESKSTDNKIDITISNIDSTNVKSPYEMILNKEESEETRTQLKNFIESGITWWSEHTNSTKGEN